MFTSVHAHRVSVAAAAALALVQLAQPALVAAQGTFPEKPIRVIVGSAAGSGPDIISRVVGERLSKLWNQRVLVEARPGVAGALSAEYVRSQPADGYTMMMLTSQLNTATHVFTDLKFDLNRDFASISLIGTVPFVLVVNPSLPVKTVADLIALARKQKLRFGSAGTGASEHLSGEMLNTLAGIDILHVPYKGVPQAITDTLANEVQMAYGVTPAVMSFITSGRLRAIGVTTPRRSAALADVPAIGETVPGYEMTAWYSFVAHSGVPSALLDRLSADTQRVVRERETAEQLKDLGVDLVGGTRAELDVFRKQQFAQIGALVKKVGAKPDR
jgi:tripartite-type tricarboxylate transporter receptor subunit TctC